MNNVLFSDQVVQVTELRRNLSSYLEKVRSGQPISIMQGNQADIAMIRRDTISELVGELEQAKRLIDTLERVIETYEILADDDMMEAIRHGEEDIAQGRFVSLEELKAELGF